MKYSYPLITTAALSLLAATQIQAQTQRVFNNNDGDNLWSNSLNWTTESIADTNSEFAQLNGQPIVDANFTINRIQNNFNPSDQVVSSTNGGVLTIDLNTAGNTGVAIRNVRGGVNPVSNLQFSGNVTIDNTLGGFSNFGFSNSSGDSITFTNTSVLSVNSIIQTDTSGATNSVTGFINFNGAITGGNDGSSAGIRIGAGDTGVTFGATADNTGYEGDIAIFAGSSVTSNTIIAGGFLNTGHKIQVNGDGASLVLNGAGGMQGNVVIANNNGFTLDVNANQSSLGFLNLGTGSSLTLDIDASVTELFFTDSASIDWLTGTVAISGFKENTIRFGTDASGLTVDQLNAIDGGAYSITDQGFLTAVPEVGAFGVILGMFALSLVSSRSRARKTQA